MIQTFEGTILRRGAIVYVSGSLCDRFTRAEALFGAGRPHVVALIPECLFPDPGSAIRDRKTQKREMVKGVPGLKMWREGGHAVTEAEITGVVTHRGCVELRVLRMLHPTPARAQHRLLRRHIRRTLRRLLRNAVEVPRG